MQPIEEEKFVDIGKLVNDLGMLSAVSDPRLPIVTNKTSDFIPRSRKIPYSFRKREIYHTRRPDRTHRKRKHPRKHGAKSHLRNYKPEIPSIGLPYNHTSIFSIDTILESNEHLVPFMRDGDLYVSVNSGSYQGTYRIGFVKHATEVDQNFLKPKRSDANLQGLLESDNLAARFFYENGRLYLELEQNETIRQFLLGLIEKPACVDTKSLLPITNATAQIVLWYTDGHYITPRYSRPHSNEESQSRPKIPFREISAIRDRSNKMRRAKYMEINKGRFISDSYTPKLPRPRRFIGDKVTTWAYTPIVKLPLRSIYS